MLERINLSKASPDLYGVVRHLDKLVSEAAASAGIADGFAHVLRLRASQINQCAFCMRMHARDAVKSGETADRLSVVSAWREAPAYFTDQERAALALLEAVTQVSEGQIPDGVYAQAAQTLSEEAIIAVEWLAVVMSAWNRIALSSRYPVTP